MGLRMPLLRFNDFGHLWKVVKDTEPQYAYGWIPDPYDERDDDYEFETTRAARSSASDVSSIDNRDYYRPISDQWHLPSCTANAGADYLEAVDIHDKVRSGADVRQARESQPDWSRMFLWWNGRNEMDPPRHHDASSGCYNRLIMDVAARFGVPEEKYWPYDEKRLPPNYDPRPIVRPSIMAYRMARPHTIESYHALMGSGDKRLEQIVKALKANPGVLFGTALGTGFGDNPDKPLYKPRDVKGRHAMVIVGYDRQMAAFLVRNSWGKSFGMEGYFWMHESYVAWSKTRSLWVCTKGAL